MLRKWGILWNSDSERKGGLSPVLDFCGRKLLPGMDCVPLADFWPGSWSV